MSATTDLHPGLTPDQVGICPRCKCTVRKIDNFCSRCGKSLSPGPWYKRELSVLSSINRIAGGVFLGTALLLLIVSAENKKIIAVSLIVLLLRYIGVDPEAFLRHGP